MLRHRTDPDGVARRDVPRFLRDHGIAAQRWDGGGLMGWYLSRLASMAPAEIIWHARNTVRRPLDWARVNLAQIQVPAPNVARLQLDYPVRLHADAAAI